MTTSTIKVKVVRRPSLKLKVLPRFPANVTVSGPITLDRTGGNYGFGFNLPALGLAASATTDTTNANNITSGTLPAARLPNPTASTLGGVKSIAAVSHNWINSISTSGVPALSQPAFSDISGVATGAQLPNPSASTLGGIQSLAAVASNWINSISTSGVPIAARPTFTDISGNIAVSQMNSGTGASSSTFWRGDGTWASLSGAVTSIAGNAGAFTLGGGITNSVNNIQLALNNATLQATPGNPTASSSVAGVMMGLGASCHITPVYGTRVLLEFYGNVAGATAGSNSGVQAKFGTGGAPVNGAAATGTNVGSLNLVGAAVSSVPGVFKTGGIITGLTAGTAYWFDIVLSASAGTATPTNITCYALEF